jgi:uncharacterized protein (TIGR02246 family)
MGTATDGAADATPEADAPVIALYHDLLAAWNARDAAAYAALCDAAAEIVGFDGSQMHGRVEIERTLGQIFADHVTARYVSIVRGVTWLAPQAGLLRAVVGMVPPGAAALNPAVNAVQSLVAVRRADAWRVVLFQNTPAQFHSRPDLAAALTAELQAQV